MARASSIHDLHFLPRFGSRMMVFTAQQKGLPSSHALLAGMLLCIASAIMPTVHALEAEDKDSTGTGKFSHMSCPAIRTSFGLDSSTPAASRTSARSPHVMNCKEFSQSYLDKGAKNKGNKRVATLTESIRLSEACHFEKAQVVIAASNVSLDCGGSTFSGGNRLSFGLSLAENERKGTASKSLQPIRHVEVSNCKFDSYNTSGVILRNYFDRTNPADQEFYNAILLPMQQAKQFDEPGSRSPADRLRELSPSDIVLKNISVRNTGNAGIFVQNSVTDVKIVGADVRYTRAGIYLDFGTRDIRVENSCFVDVGVKDPELPPAGFNAGRESIAIDSSAKNRVTGNVFINNVAGGIHTYKNCWESHDNYKDDSARMAQYPRRQQASHNVISDNVFFGGMDGISIAERQWSKLRTDKNCGDPAVDQMYSDSGAEAYRVYQDYSRHNVISGNRFYNMLRPIRIQDDFNSVENNTFYLDKNSVAIQVGSKMDKRYRKRPLNGIALGGNSTVIDGRTRSANVKTYGDRDE